MSGCCGARDSVANLKITGMKCQGCAERIEKTLSGLEGITGVEVNLDRHEARISYDASRIGEEDIKVAVENLGYGVL
ncbi:MAG: heavy-metal-associated domain-containing protein [Firmicutes bacterium]|nr:heavy-metal-associated domain-containing protein [Bacillota bacterium]